jgi:hypothetical protein
MVQGNAHSLTQKILPHLEKKMEIYIKLCSLTRASDYFVKLRIERKNKIKMNDDLG